MLNLSKSNGCYYFGLFENQQQRQVKSGNAPRTARYQRFAPHFQTKRNHKKTDGHRRYSFCTEPRRRHIFQHIDK